MPFINPAHTYAISINMMYREQAQVKLFLWAVTLGGELVHLKVEGLLWRRLPCCFIAKKYGFVKADES